METEALQMKLNDEQGAGTAGCVGEVSPDSRSWSVLGHCARWLAATLLAAIVGSWLVWYAAYVQRQQTEEDIRAACRRVMPETVDRCFDTVVLQRGGVRR
jgi:hypothetical protein